MEFILQAEVSPSSLKAELRTTPPHSNPSLALAHRIIAGTIVKKAKQTVKYAKETRLLPSPETTRMRDGLPAEISVRAHLPGFCIFHPSVQSLVDGLLDLLVHDEIADLRLNVTDIEAIPEAKRSNEGRSRRG